MNRILREIVTFKDYLDKDFEETLESYEGDLRDVAYILTRISTLCNKAVMELSKRITGRYAGTGCNPNE